MTLKTLETRFNDKINKIYGRYSARDSSDGVKSEQPFLEFKPNDPDKNEVNHDNRVVPKGSIKRDIERVGKFLSTSNGLMFLLKEQILQSGNTFSETRILNPLFVIENVQPYIHFKRPLRISTDIGLSGDLSQRSPASTSKIGVAGRLHSSTAKDAIARAGIQDGKSKLLSLLPLDKLIKTVLNTLTLGLTDESLGVNKRPELDINGEYYSVLIWKGKVNKSNSVSSNLEEAKKQLMAGHLKSAKDALVGAIKSVTQTLTGKDNRNSKTSTINGSRYFIKDEKEADRYLKDSIQFDTKDGHDVPIVNLSRLNRIAYFIPESKTTIVDGFSKSFGSSTSITSGLDKIKSAIKQQLSDVEKKLKNLNSSFISLPKGLGFTIPTAVPTGPTENFGKDAMLFPESSLEARYNALSESNIETVRGQLAEVKKRGAKYWARDEVKNHSNLGFVGGIRPDGTPQNINPRERSSIVSYSHDTINDVGVISESPTSQQPSKENEKYYDKDLIKVLFFDYVNKLTIPFRAYISNINENIIPDISDTRYIGRLERNIVYVGVTRELNFALNVYAFNKKEMDSIWTKINALTGLCYPSKYDNGFMVPPLIKLTIGDLYYNQPGYIKSLSHLVEEGTSWEIESGHQAPYGLMMNITFIAIEKKLMSAKSKFYSFGQPREFIKAGDI